VNYRVCQSALQNKHPFSSDLAILLFLIGSRNNDTQGRKARAERVFFIWSEMKQPVSLERKTLKQRRQEWEQQAITAIDEAVEYLRDNKDGDIHINLRAKKKQMRAMIRMLDKRLRELRLFPRWKQDNLAYFDGGQYSIRIEAESERKIDLAPLTNGQYSGRQLMRIASDVWQERTPEARIRKLLSIAKAPAVLVYPVRDFDAAEQVSDRISDELERLGVDGRWGEHMGGDFCVGIGDYDHTIYIEPMR
jgi:hypothetical protein